MSKSFKVTYRGDGGKPEIIIIVRDSVFDVLEYLQTKLWAETISRIEQVEYIDLEA
jgi:hypothetical protein